MEFRDLKKQYRNHQEAIDGALAGVLSRADFIGGKAVGELEEKLAAYVGVKHCVTCANGTDALQLALMAWGIGPEDVVFVPDFTFFSSGEVVSAVGATPVFVDVEKETFNMDVQSLKEAIERVKSSTDLIPKVIVAVDLFGQPADYSAIRKIADENNLLILEDSAQGFGGRIGDRKTCSFGDISTTSFFPAKPLGCYGDGGAVFTDDDNIAAILKSLKVHGKGTDKYDNIRIGMNSRLDTLQAAVLLQKMDFFEEEIENCNQAAEFYSRKLGEYVTVPKVKEGFYSGWAQYTILLKDEEQRNRTLNELKSKGIPTAVYYQKPMHQQKAFEEKQPVKIDCPNTEAICQTCLSLPMHGYLEEEDMKTICKAIVESLQ